MQSANILRIGHRGAGAYEPENTLRSFKKALELGLDAIELDVRMARDGSLVVIHDATVDRTTNGKGLVSDLTIEEMKELVIEKDEKIPTLEEALDFLDRKVKILIELKETGLERKVLGLVSSRGLEKSVLLVSYLEEALKKIRDLNNETETGLIYREHNDPVGAALELKANFLLPFYRLVDSVDIRNAHGRGLKVVVWPINTKEEVSEYAKKGVDGIVSDKPDVLTLPTAHSNHD